MTAYVDGGSRRNPGPAGYGIRIEESDGALVAAVHGALGIATNNAAEKRRLLAALQTSAQARQRADGRMNPTKRPAAAPSRRYE